MKKMKFNLILLTVLSIFSSCSDYTDGINKSPNEFTDAPGDLLIGQANLAVIKINGSQASRISGIWTDQFTGSDRQYISLDSYIVTSGDFDDDWSDLYTGLAQSKLAETKAIENDDIFLEGVSKIMQAILLGEATSLWGDVPDSEAGDYITSPNPLYDSQVDVFAHVQDLLTDAISKLGETTVSGTYDTGFKSEGTWSEIAHSLKARYYLVAKDYPAALSEAKSGITLGNDLLSIHTSSSGSRNLYYQFIVEERGGYLTAGGPSKLHNLLSGAEPRLLVTPGDSKRKDVYFDGTELNTNVGGYFAIDSSFPLVSYIETKLIEAEAAQRANGSTGSEGLIAFNEARTHLASEYSGDFPLSTSSGINLTNEILEEKYISMIGSLQVFHDARRTNNVLSIPVKSTSATSIPQRFLYPQSEIGANKNFPGVIGLFEKTSINN
jgi:hypothetical protein